MTVIIRSASMLLCALFAVRAVSGQATSTPLAIKAVAEVESRVIQSGHETVKLEPADRVVPGDQVIYTLEIRNATANAVATPIVTYAIPAHMIYVADSASGPGAELTYSADGGYHFDRPENLRSVDGDGHMVQEKASNYTHIRWKLKETLKANSVALARFRAVVK